MFFTYFAPHLPSQVAPALPVPSGAGLYQIAFQVFRALLAAERQLTDKGEPPALQLLPRLPTGLIGYHYQRGIVDGPGLRSLTLLVNCQRSLTRLPWVPGWYHVLLHNRTTYAAGMNRLLLGTHLTLAGDEALMLAK